MRPFPRARSVLVTAALIGTLPLTMGAGEVAGIPAATCRAADGFELRVAEAHEAAAEVAATFGGEAAFYAEVCDSARDHYDDLRSLGLRKPSWDPYDQGFVVFNGNLPTEYEGGGLRIFIPRWWVEFLAAEGYEYGGAAAREILRSVIGHEMVHGFQHEWVDDTGQPTKDQASVEGLARFAESLTAVGPISHTSDSPLFRDWELCASTGAASGACAATGLLLASPSCNAYGDETKGPAGKSYAACRWWMTWYASHGAPALARLLNDCWKEEAADEWEEIRFLAECGSAGDVTWDLARFAASLYTGCCAMYAPTPRGVPLDWSEHLVRYSAQTLGAGGTRTSELSGGGVVGFEVVSDGMLLAEGPAGTSFFVLRGEGTETRIDPLGPGTADVAQNPGVRVWAVAVNAGHDDASVELELG